MPKNPSEDPKPNEPADVESNPMEGGLAAGFGPATTPPAGPARSILERLASHSGVRPRIMLRDEPSQTPSKVLRPLGPNSAGLPSLQGKYQLQGEIARGGVGVILKGHDVDLGRDVAMKFLHEKYAGNPDMLQRFVEEAQIGGQLQHPGIVPVYDLGLSDDRPYFTMKLVKGRTLAALFEERDDPASDRQRILSIFEQVCQTIAYAHARGVIHRDLKPANVMVGAFGEVQVVDWGMGKVLFAGGTADEARAEQKTALSVIETVRSQPGTGSTHSIVGSVMGTPAYMPPEQANGDVERMDERSDVFALGAILCEILTGMPPYVGEADELLTMAAKAQLDSCKERLERSGVDDELRELCTDCLMPVPVTRPRHAGIVADRIASYLAGVEERGRHAQIEAAEERVRAGAARRSQRLTLALAISVVVTLILGGGGAWWVERQAQDQRAAAIQQVSNSLGEASVALGQARAAGPGDLELWDRAVAAAEQSVGLAEFDAVPEEQRLAARATLTKITNERTAALRRERERVRDAKMRERLTLLRVPADEDVRGDEWPRDEAMRLDRAYRGAFAEYLGGVQLQGESQDEAIALLADGEDPVQLAAALDHWALIRDKIAPEDDERFARETDRLRELAAHIDAEDPWRGRLRALLPGLRSNRVAIERLAAEVDLWALPVASIVLLGEALWEAGAVERAVEVYRIARKSHPSDFGTCIRLGILLERLDDPPLEEIVGLLRIANALRPDMREVMHRQVMALQGLHMYEDARLMCEELSRLDPEDQDWILHLRFALTSLGRWERVIEVSQRMLELADSETQFPWNHRAYALQSAGSALSKLGRFEEALESYRRAGEVVEDYRQVNGAEEITAEHWSSVMALSLAGDVESLEGLLAQLPTLEGILSGQQRPASGQEWAQAAKLALDRQDNLLAARTWLELFGAHPELEAEYKERYNAACAAALCAAGRGRGADQHDAEQRSRWRRQALKWLRDELASQVASGEGDARGVTERLRHWQRGPDLAGLRERAAIAELPRNERTECREFWAAVRVQVEELEDRSAGR